MKAYRYAIDYYFAYGSNMNPARMRARGIHFTAAIAAQLPDFKLCFNKRAAGKVNVAYANIGYAPGACVEGVIYRLAVPEDITIMDPFEGSPFRYSRDVYPLRTDEGEIPAWVYVANPAMIADGLLPERNYMQHLLAGKAWHSTEYQAWLSAHPCLESDTCLDELGLKGLIHNV